MATITLAGEKYELITSKLTFAEGRAFEKVTGQIFAEVTQDVRLFQRIDTQQALIWISIKRVRPEFRFEDLDSLQIDAVDWAGDEEEGEPDPTQPSDDEASPSPASD